MFLRSTAKKVKGKTYRYWKLVENRGCQEKERAIHDRFLSRLTKGAGAPG